MLSEAVVHVVHDVTEVVEDVEEIKEVHLVDGVQEFNQAQQLEDDCSSQTNSSKSTDSIWIVFELHLGNEAANKADHVKSKEPGEVGLGTFELCVDDSLQSNVVIDIISKLAVDLGDNFLNGWCLVRTYWFSSSDCDELSE
jgi:hypothetical protein